LEKSLFQKEMMKMIMQVGVTMGKEQAALFDYVWHKFDVIFVTLAKICYRPSLI
jgi:hypothetical protein